MVGARRGGGAFPVQPLLQLLVPLVLLVPLGRLPPSVPLEAEVRQRVTIDVLSSLAYGSGLPDLGLAAGSARAELELASFGSSDVRSRLQLRAELYDGPDGSAESVLSVPRAEVRWRMRLPAGSLRIRAGRTRLSWGDGQLYNAGEVLNGARPEQVDLTARTLRDETQWLLSAYLPLGRFAFLEPVAVLPPAVLGDDATVAAAPAHTSAGGLRVQGQVAGIKSEVGYLYRGAGELHQPYLSLQGNLGVDLYGGIRWEWRHRAGTDAPREAVTASAGAFAQRDHRRLGTGTLRVEALWEETGGRWYLAPDLSWAPSQLLNFFSRSEVELGTGTTEWRSSGGIRWTPVTGLTISGLVGWDAAAGGSLALGSGLRYVF